MKTKAITLTETILVILIIGTIMACLAPYLKGIQDFWIFTDRQTAILQGARDAMNKMIKTLKAAHSITDIDPSGRGTYLALTNYLDQPIVYFHNIESSPYYIGNTGNIKIGDLVMQTKDPSNNTVNSLLCQSIDSITFTYIKPSMDRSDPATSPDQVQAVRILFYAKDPDQTTDIKLPISCLAYLMNVKASSGGGSWAKVIGGSGGELATSVQQTADGGYIIVGYTTSFGAVGGWSDAYLIKTDSSGAIEWSKTFGGNKPDEISFVQQTSDGGYIITGTTYSFGTGAPNAYLVRTDASGNRVWSKVFNTKVTINSVPPKIIDARESFNPIQETTDGGYIMAGYKEYNRYLRYPNSVTATYDILIVKTNSLGIPEWSKIFAGNLRNERANSVQQTVDSGYVLSGTISPYNPTDTLGANFDVYAIKLYSSGSLDWSKSFGSSFHDVGNAIQQTSDRGYMIAGFWHEPSANAYLIKISPDTLGEHEWSKTFGGTGAETIYSAQQTSDGGYIMAGYTESFGAVNRDVYFIKTGSSGSHVWSKTFGGNKEDKAGGVIQTSDGGYLMVGSTRSFGSGSYDFYLIKTDSQGNCPGAATPEVIIDAPTRWPDTPDLYNLNPAIDTTLPVYDPSVPEYDPAEPD